MPEIRYEISPDVSNEALNTLFFAVWEHHQSRDFLPVLKHSLLWVCAYSGNQLIGFVNVVWDGGKHAFILDTSVHPDFQRHGIGIELVKRANLASTEKGILWMHVDYEAHLTDFYAKCGFRTTVAGLLNLQDTSS
ncbi:MAG: GNAT family N-acetyltransferase [Aggregatilineales bacterium]